MFLSITTIMESYPSLFGSFTIKLVETPFHGAYVADIDCINPYHAWLVLLDLTQITPIYIAMDISSKSRPVESSCN